MPTGGSVGVLVERGFGRRCLSFSVFVTVGSRSDDQFAALLPHGLHVGELLFRAIVLHGRTPHKHVFDVAASDPMAIHFKNGEHADERSSRH